MAYYDLGIHEINVNMAFVNSDLYEKFTQCNPKCFVMEEKEHKGCHLKKPFMD
jgi:hypothetical protein